MKKKQSKKGIELQPETIEILRKNKLNIKEVSALITPSRGVKWYHKQVTDPSSGKKELLSHIGVPDGEGEIDILIPPQRRLLSTNRINSRILGSIKLILNEIDKDILYIHKRKDSIPTPYSPRSLDYYEAKLYDEAIISELEHKLHILEFEVFWRNRDGEFNSKKRHFQKVIRQASNKTKGELMRYLVNKKGNSRGVVAKIISDIIFAEYGIDQSPASIKGSAHIYLRKPL